jgi:hypothetical protein
MHRKMGLGECTQMFAVKVGFCELLSYSYLNFKTFFDEIKMHTGSISIIGVVAHTYNPSYSGGKDQEDQGSKPIRENS